MATIWYAQNSSANVNSANMWNDVADGSGNWLTWANLDPTDTLRANGKTAIAINVDTTCAQIDTLTSGGGFVLNDGITLTANVVAGTTDCVTFSAASPAAAAITGDVTGSTASAGRRGAVVSGTGTLTITGTVTGGGTTAAVGVLGGAGGSIVVVGDCYGGGNSSAHGVSVTNGTLSVTGDIFGSGTSTGYGVNFAGTTCSVTGAATGGATGAALNATAGVVTMVGNAVAGGREGVYTSGASHLRLQGNVIAKDTTGRPGLACLGVMSVVNGEDYYTDYAEADTTPGDVTGELVRHYGLGALPTPAEVAAAVWTYDGTAGRTLTG